MNETDEKCLNFCWKNVDNSVKFDTFYAKHSKNGVFSLNLSQSFYLDSSVSLRSNTFFNSGAFQSPQSFKCPEQNLMPWISEISLRKLLLLFISTRIRRGMLGGNWGSRLKRTGGFLLEQCRLLQLFKVISVQIEINLARPQFLCQKHTQKQTGPGLNPHCCNLKFFLLKGPRRCKEHDYTSGKKKQVLRRKSSST